jgi:hypothetical protein
LDLLLIQLTNICRIVPLWLFVKHPVNAWVKFIYYLIEVFGIGSKIEMNHFIVNILFDSWLLTTWRVNIYTIEFVKFNINYEVINKKDLYPKFMRCNLRWNKYLITSTRRRTIEYGNHNQPRNILLIQRSEQKQSYIHAIPK